MKIKVAPLDTLFLITFGSIILYFSIYNYWFSYLSDFSLRIFQFGLNIDLILQPFALNTFHITILTLATMVLLLFMSLESDWDKNNPIESVSAKISKYRKKMNISVYFIQPVDLSICFIAFKGRQRQFHYSHFVRTHSGARNIFLCILKKYHEVNCFYNTSKPTGIDNVDSDENLIYKEYTYSREEMTSIIENIQLSEEEIINIIKPLI